MVTSLKTRIIINSALRISCHIICFSCWFLKIKWPILHGTDHFLRTFWNIVWVRRCNSYLYTYVAELYSSNICCVTNVCIIDLNVTLFPFYVYIQGVAITLLITDFLNKIFVFNFKIFGLLTMFYQPWTKMGCNCKNLCRTSFDMFYAVFSCSILYTFILWFFKNFKLDRQLITQFCVVFPSVLCKSLKVT
jgi:hypothetical protein